MVTVIRESMNELHTHTHTHTHTHYILKTQIKMK